nr:glycoprotein-N-acetylgalactosamine 3-beta-galactosyltransferase 1-like [Leptinotarsa decemlineata]
MNGMNQNKLYFYLVVGIVIGFTIAYVTLTPTTTYKYSDDYHNHPKNVRFHKSHQNKKNNSVDHDHEDKYEDYHRESDMDSVLGPKEEVGAHNDNDTFHKMTNTDLADALYKEVKILCWVMTGPENHDKKAKHVKATWGKRCNILLFMSSQKDETLPAIALPVGEGRNNLWAKTKEAFKYVFENYFDEIETDMYVILENLRYMLLGIDPQRPIYFGAKFKPYVKQGYMSGGAGYVLSKEALRKFVVEAIPNREICRADNEGAEDVEIGKCLAAVNVEAGDSRDPESRGRFFAFTPLHHLIPGHVDKSFWYWQYIYYNESQGMECCSDNAVSFHYMSPDMMYTMEYLLYHLRPFGIAYDPKLPPKLSEILKDHSKENEVKVPAETQNEIISHISTHK